MFDGEFLSLKDKMKFKLKSCKESVVKANIGEDMKRKLVPGFGMKLQNAMMKKLCTMSFISSSDESKDQKIYFYKEGEQIVGEIDNKKQKIRDSIGIPVTSDYFGDWTVPVICKLDNFRMWNPLNVDVVNVAILEGGKAAVILNDAKTGDKFVKIKIINTVLKQ
jgi:hypothetical protein